MLGKIIAHAPTRREAAQCFDARLHKRGARLVTNREHLARILAHPASSRASSIRTFSTIIPASSPRGHPG